MRRIAIKAFTSKVELMGGKTDLCNHDVGFPFSSTACFHVHGSHRVVIIKFDVVFPGSTQLFTGRLSFFDNTAASAT